MSQQNLEIVIDQDESNKTSRLGSQFIMIIVGIILIAISSSGSEPTTSGIVFGVILLVGGTIFMITFLYQNSRNKGSFAIKINSQTIFLSSMITGEKELIEISIDHVKEVTSQVSPGGYRSLSLFLKKTAPIENEYIDLDIGIAMMDWLEIKALLNEVIKKSLEERTQLIEVFLVSKSM